MGNKKPSNQSRRRQPVESMQFRKNKYAAPVGGIFIFLAIVGLIALTTFSVNFTRSILDSSGETEKFEKIIAPVLMFDPVPFENAVDADPLFLLQSSLWSTLLGEKRSSYVQDGMGYLPVPSSDVDVTCAKLFGPEVKLEHQTFGDYETTYQYDKVNKKYLVPVTGQIGLYTPSVNKVVKKGNVFTLEVGYIPPSNAWTQGLTGENNKPESDKEMLYELTAVKDHYQLTAIRDVPKEASSSVAPSSGSTQEEIVAG